MMVVRVLMVWALATTAAAQGVQMAALNPATTRAIEDVVQTAAKDFTRMPQVRLNSALAGVCGGDATSNTWVQYCTDLNTIFVAADLADVLGPDPAAYAVAHAFGHAVQVVHGQADRALSVIQADRAREAELRGMVTRQVECVAGVIYGRAMGSGGSLTDWFATEPFADSHWGRSPIARGPVVSIGLAQHDAWFRRGQAGGTVEVCAAGEMGVEALLRGMR